MKASDNPFPSILLEEATEPAAPAAGHQRLYIDSTSHKLKRTDSSGTDVTVEGLSDQGAITYLDATEAAAPATPASGKVRIYAKTDGRIYSKDDAGTEYGPFDAAGAGAGREVWEIDEPPVSPNALDDEFDDSGSISDWTAFGRSLSTSEINATGKESLLHLYLANNTGGSQLAGLYKTMPTSYPFYIVTSVAESTWSTNYCRGGGIVLLNSAVDDACYVGLVYNSGYRFNVVIYTGLDTFASTAMDILHYQMPARFRIKVNSATSFDFQVPHTFGVLATESWRSILSAQNPGFSIAKAGPGMATEGNSSLAAVWDYFRVIE